MTSVLEFSKALAREAGEMIRHERDNTTLGHEFKNGRELVTSADLKADALICARIKAAFPDHLILSEESSPQLRGVQTQQQPVWIIDPIDGTVNYAHGHRQSAVCIAWAESGNIETGVVYNPFTDELFSAARGGGAELNGTSIVCSAEADLSRTLIATGFPYDHSERQSLLPRLMAVLDHCGDLRRLGSAALDICWVACGRLDGFYENLSLWDFAAAGLVAREAGAAYGHIQPPPAGVDPQFHDRDIIVANPHIFTDLQRLLQQADEAR
ncbi:MAG: inositol monophosphatase family protein [Gammaproteobacteria bacterium]